MNKTVYWFNEVDKNDINLVGGKGANLGELYQNKIPVPNGFIVSAQAYFKFLKFSSLDTKIKDLLKKVDPNNGKLLQEASSLIKKVIISSPIPESIVEEISAAYEKLVANKEVLVAIRSSATAEDLPGASFAGQQATFLNIKGLPQTLEAIKKCWASLFETRAIFYRANQGYDHFKVGIAVPVQKMVQSEVSGVMFTLDPTTSDKTKIVIESVWGLGEMIVQGKVNPDHYEVNKTDFKITNRELGNQAIQMVRSGNKTVELKVGRKFIKEQKLPDNKIIELAKLGRKIENHYLFPQDLEWALEDNQLFIVQTRPVTTIEGVSKVIKEGNVKNLTEDLPLLLSGSSACPGVAWGKVVILKNAKEIDKVKTGDVLVTTMTNPDFVPAMKRAAAIITDKGGKTSHAAIVSRELGVPCVVGTNYATKKLKTGSGVTVDGTNGKVFSGSPNIREIHLLARTADKEGEVKTDLKTATKVYVNLAEPELASEMGQRKVDGIGLLRAEFMIAQIGTHPKKLIKERRSQVFVNSLADNLKTFCSAFDSRPVIYRATDFKTNEYKDLKGGAEFEAHEENPLLGYRGALRFIMDPDVFELELEAIKKVRNKFGFKNLWLMIPFVRTIKEMEEVKKLVSSSGLHRSPSFKLIMMCEIPSNVILIEEFLETGIDGVSIGSNDLTMLILGADRDNDKVSGDFNELDPAVLWAMEKVIKACLKKRLYVGICGQAPSIFPELTKKLVQWGISSVSVSPDAIEKTRQIIFEAEKELVNKRKS